MLFENINPFIRQVLIGNLKSSHTQDVHTKIKTVDSRLFYIIEGGGNMIIENVSYPLTPGTLILFGAGTEYIWDIEDVKFYSVNFDYTLDFSYIKNTFHPIHSSLFCEEQIILRSYFEDMERLNAPLILESASMLEPTLEQLLTEYCVSGKYADMLLSSLLKSVIISAIRLCGDTAPKEQAYAPLVRQIIEYMNAHYEEAISNETIAAHFNFNSAYLNRIFKNNTGNTMHEFLISRRLSTAMEMLRSQNMPVGEVAQKCGFQSLYHFTKTFKKRTRMSPSEYRIYNA